RNSTSTRPYGTVTSENRCDCSAARSKWLRGRGRPGSTAQGDHAMLKNHETSHQPQHVEAPKPQAAEMAYRSPGMVELGRLGSLQATSYGNTYDGVYTTRSWWYTRG